METANHIQNKNFEINMIEQISFFNVAKHDKIFMKIINKLK